MSLDLSAIGQRGDIADTVAKSLSKARNAAHLVMKENDWPKSSEAIHDLRVALRRLNVVNTALADLLPKKMSRKLKRRIRKLRRGAGQIRDDDVLRHAVVDLANENSTYAFAADIVIKKLIKSRLKLLQALRRSIVKQEQDGFWDWGIKRQLSRLSSENITKPELYRLAYDSIDDKLSQLTRCMTNARANQDADLHAVRIAVKGVRYSLELFSDWLISIPAAELRFVMISLQDLLGHVHDATIFASRCDTWAEDPELPATEQAELKKMATAFRDRRYHSMLSVDAVSRPAHLKLVDGGAKTSNPNV